MTHRARALVSAALFVALGLVGAFLVSALADALDDGRGDAPPQGLQVPAAPVVDPAETRVEVLNGAGTTGLARDATHALRADGFDVVFFGNADRFDHERTVVIDRMGHPHLARAVAASLGVDSVTTVLDSTLMLEVTVLLGADWPPAALSEGALSDPIRELQRQDVRLRDLLRRDGSTEADSSTDVDREG